jgi:hypothetical protein
MSLKPNHLVLLPGGLTDAAEREAAQRRQVGRRLAQLAHDAERLGISADELAGTLLRLISPQQRKTGSLTHTRK